MRVRLRRLVIFCSVNILPRKKSRKVKGIYSGRLCEVCGELIKGLHKAEHLQERHPEYAFRTYTLPNAYSRTYQCTTCNLTCGGVGAVVRHYRKYHPELLEK